MFAAIPESGLSIAVVPNAQRARLRVNSVQDVRGLLRALADPGNG